MKSKKENEERSGKTHLRARARADSSAHLLIPFICGAPVNAYDSSDDTTPAFVPDAELHSRGSYHPHIPDRACKRILRVRVGFKYSLGSCTKQTRECEPAQPDLGFVLAHASSVVSTSDGLPPASFAPQAGVAFQFAPALVSAAGCTRALDRSRVSRGRSAHSSWCYRNHHEHLLYRYLR